MNLNEKFKDKEREFRSKIPSNTIVGLRLDGKAFHNFTKQYARPYDEKFMNAMDNTAMTIINDLIMGAMFGYVQSDEITIFFTDKWSNKSEFVFDGKIEKILSTSASTATGAYLKSSPDCEGIPVFDARVFTFSNLDEVQEYMDWRRLDARKNAVTMAASMIKSHKQLMNMPTSQRMQILEGTEYEKLPETFFNGRLIVKKSFDETITFFDKRIGEDKTIQVVRDRLIVEPALRDKTEGIIQSFRNVLIEKMTTEN